MKQADLIARGRRVLTMERDSLDETSRRLDDSFAQAVMLVASATGRVIVAGIGKSGLIARKIAATLTSTGTPATFLHPVESAHGDLGIVSANDVAILLSKSGETTEVLGLLEPLRRVGVRVIAITSDAKSTLGRQADVHLDAWVKEEACPHDLAPTTSTTVTLALGDALAVALLEVKGFKREDFARLHPGGALGRKLLLRVADVMVDKALPTLQPSATMRDAIVELSSKRGIAVIVNGDRRVQGVITTGDLTRLMEKERDVMTVPVANVMSRSPRTAHIDELASAVVFRMQEQGVIAMPVVDADDRLAGVVHLHDLMRAGAS
ncbi:MAG TPA: KpsF/GutQ family sugar-phosphate isomerase [Gemmatimonadaceae bacterium]|nr:KpsF/GutQ family sugar-phosphate isomerase [Gemmatimonadaceae bacterium]